MTWRTELREGSFRGVTFGISDLPGQLGRKTAVHNFVERDAPLVEDLGKLPRSFTIEAFVVGPDYTTRRDELEAALEEPGPGTFVHPYRGEMQVALSGPVSVREGLSGGLGQAVFTIPFVLVGDSTLPRGSRGAAAARSIHGALAESAGIAALNRGLGVAGQGSYVFNNAVNDVTAAIARAQAISQGNVVTIVSTTAQALGQDEANAIQILTSSLAGERLYSIYRTEIAKSSAGSNRTAQNLNALAATVTQPQMPDEPDAEARLVEQNSAAIARFEREACTRLMVEEYAKTVPESKTHAQQIIAQIVERCAEVVANVADDDAGSAVAAAFTDLSAAAVAAVALAARQSPNVRRYEVLEVTPSLVLAHRYGVVNSGIEAMALDFAARNGEANPLFCEPRLKEVLVYE